MARTSEDVKWRGLFGGMMCAVALLFLAELYGFRNRFEILLVKEGLFLVEFVVQSIISGGAFIILTQLWSRAGKLRKSTRSDPTAWTEFLRFVKYYLALRCVSGGLWLFFILWEVIL